CLDLEGETGVEGAGARPRLLEECGGAAEKHRGLAGTTRRCGRRRAALKCVCEMLSKPDPPEQGLGLREACFRVGDSAEPERSEAQIEESESLSLRASVR